MKSGIAKHPTTGEEIRILQSEASIWRNQKTLVWLTGKEAKEPWNRWDIATTSIADAKALKKGGINVNAVICLNSSDDEIFSWLQAGHWKNILIVAVTKAFIESVGYEKISKLRLSNVICLEEIHEMYPHVGGSWDGSVNDAKIIITIMMKHSRTFPIQATQRVVPTGLTLIEELLTPPKLWYLTQSYRSSSGKRTEELALALKKNLECKMIDHVVLLNEEPICNVIHPKLTEKVIGSRLKYSDVIKWIRDEKTLPEDALVVFANADIYLDEESWRMAWSFNPRDTFVALLRWDIQEDGAEPVLFGPRGDSQDTWMVDVASVRSRSWDMSTLDFYFGKSGCDNAIALEMFKQKFLVVNPAFTLLTYHLHMSQVRTYEPVDIIKKPAYLYIHPSGIHDLKPVMHLDPKTTVEHKGISRAIRGPLTKMQAATYAKMLSRSTGGSIKLDPDRPVVYTPEKTPLYHYKDVFQTREGLVFTYNSILVGSTKKSKEIWSRSELSTLLPCVASNIVLVAPLPEEVARNPNKYVLEYLSKIFLMKKMYPDGEFWCSKNESFLHILKLFDWKEKDIPLLCYDTTPQSWCKEAIVWNYLDRSEITKEEVGALRERFMYNDEPWLSQEEKGTQKRIVIIVDETCITDSVLSILDEKIDEKCILDVVWDSGTNHCVICRTLLGASGVILSSNSLSSSFIWCLPIGATVYEFQYEMQPSADILHLAAAAELQHSLSIFPKGVKNIAEMVEKALEGVIAETSSSGLPIIRVPTHNQGYFGHTGDSFREMVRLWGESGYVEVEPSPDLCQIWMGDVLLYDRPTLEWLRRAPPSELKWRKALFGNPTPLEGESAWSFWPRRPEIVEALVKEGIPNASYEERKKNLVFYGRSENAVQKKNRTKEKWALACDEFLHLEGETPYPYTHEEYLRRLAAARFGLCLAGFGQKCHREIECMAMGCVPLVAPEVDMTSYANPPIEGTHYFRVKNPDQATRVIIDTSEQQWSAMSVACRAWWFQNASVDGLWDLTERLAA